MNEIKTDLTTNGLNPKEIDTGIARATIPTSSAVGTWIFTILINIGTYLFLYNKFLNTGQYELIAFLKSPGTHFIVLSTSLLSIIPTYLSGIHSKYVNRVAYGIPLVIIVFGVVLTLSEGIFPYGLVFLPFFISAVVFIIFLILGSFFRRSAVQIVVSFLIIEIIAFTVTGIFMVQKSEHVRSTNEKFSSLTQENSHTMNPREAVEICDSIPYSLYNSLHTECWNKAIILYPNVNMCNLSNKSDSKGTCQWNVRMLYDTICEGNNSNVSLSKKDDPVENNRLVQCWIEKTEIYPEIDICHNSYEWNKVKCMTARDSVPAYIEKRNSR